MPTYPTHAPVAMMQWGTHAELKQADEVVFITVEHLEVAERASRERIGNGDTVLLYTGLNDRVPSSSPGLFTDFSGLVRESAIWLREKGIRQLRRGGDQPGAAETQQLSRSPGLSRHGLHPHGGPGQF
jgi:kynurenine formamidase